jgi:hypothetical protein
MKPALKSPETERLILSYDEPLSKFALKFDLCNYTMLEAGRGAGNVDATVGPAR